MQIPAPSSMYSLARVQLETQTLMFLSAYEFATIEQLETQEAVVF
jgi:hypothetical protein